MPTRECISHPSESSTTNKVSKTENLIHSCAASLVVVGDACVLPMRTALKKFSAGGGMHPPGTALEYNELVTKYTYR